MLLLRRLWTKHFNSQPHKEADIITFLRTYENNISTHSLTRRLTGIHKGIVLCDDISTHSLTRRLTHLNRF